VRWCSVLFKFLFFTLILLVVLVAFRASSKKFLFIYWFLESQINRILRKRMNKYWPETEKPDESKSTIKFNLFEIEEEGSKTRNWKVEKERFFHYLYLSFFNSRVLWLFLILCFSVSRKFAFKFTTFSCSHVFGFSGLKKWNFELRNGLLSESQ
jgi:hypothetical protein